MASTHGCSVEAVAAGKGCTGAEFWAAAERASGAAGSWACYSGGRAQNKACLWHQPPESWAPVTCRGTENPATGAGVYVCVGVCVCVFLCV